MVFLCLYRFLILKKNISTIVFYVEIFCERFFMSEKHSLIMPSTLAPIYKGDYLEKRLKMVRRLDGSFRFQVVEQTRKGDSLSQKFLHAAFRFFDDETKLRNVATRIRDVMTWKDSMVLREYATEDEAKKLLRDFDKTVRECKKAVWYVRGQVLREYPTDRVAAKIQREADDALNQGHEKDQIYIEKHGLKL